MSGIALAVSAALLVANGGFVAFEFGAIACQRSRIDARADAGSRSARAAQRMQRDILTALSGAQLGITLCSVIVGRLAEPTIAHAIEVPLEELLGLSAGAVKATGFVIALGLVTIFHMVISEMVPKNLALVGPERTLLVLARPMAWYLALVRPVVWALQAMSNVLLRLVRVEPSDELVDRVSADEFELMVQTSASHHLVSADAPALVSAALAFNETAAVELAVPLRELTVAALGEPVSDVLARLAAGGQSRMVVVAADGAPAGYVHAAHLADVADGPATLDERHLLELPEVSHDATLRDVVAVFRQNKPSLVLVLPPSAAAAGSAAGADAGADYSVVSLDDVTDNLLG